MEDNIKRIKELKEKVSRLEKDQRLALARITSDLIMSDKIIEDDEIELFACLFGGEHNRELFHNAQQLSFAKAIKLLTVMRKTNDYDDPALMAKANNNAKIAAKIIKEMSEVDGFCVPTEAIIRLAVDYYLEKNDCFYSKYDVFSFQLTDLFIGKRFVLYVDTSGSSMSLEIEKNYELIVNLLSSIGYQFVYIPKVAQQYKNKGKDWFKTISMYIFPDISEDKVEATFEKITKLTTTDFVKDYMRGKMGFDFLCPKPAFMVMLGRSSVLGKDLSDKGLAYDTNANFLKINIEDEHPLDVISNLVHDFNEIVSFNFNIDFNPAKNKLMYHGIHKAFFRLVALAKDNPNRNRISINTTLHSAFINDWQMTFDNKPLQKGRLSLYLLIMYKSYFGDKKGFPVKNVSEEEQELLQKQYEEICCLMNDGKYEKKASLYKRKSGNISDIKSSIDKTAGKRKGEFQLYVGDYAKTNVDPSCITIDNIPILEYPLFVEWG